MASHVDTTFPFHAQVPADKTLSRPSSMFWPSKLISRPAGTGVGSRSEIAPFKEVVLPVGATLGTASGSGRSSGRARLVVNRADPVEMALVADLQRSALARVAVSSCDTYTGHFNMFVAWCEALAEPRASLVLFRH